MSKATITHEHESHEAKSHGCGCGGAHATHQKTQPAQKENAIPPGDRKDEHLKLGLEAANDQILSELGIGARRISELVRVVKEYSFLDRAPIIESSVTGSNGRAPIPVGAGS